MEVDAGYSVLVQDLHQLQENTSAIRGDLGTPPSDSTFQSSWEGLVTCLQQFSALSATVSNQVNTLDELDAKHSTLHQVVTDSCLSLADSSSDLSTKVNELTSSLRILESRVLRLIPFLQHVRRNPVDSTSPVSADHPDFSAVLHRVKELETLVDNLQTRQQSWESTCQDMFLSNPSSSPAPLAAQVQELSAQMKQLKLRVVGKGVQIGNKVFQSFDEVKTFATHLPCRRYGLFVDGVSIFECFTHGHIDAETTYSSFYSQHRTGFTSSIEARIASSVQNLFPTVFGKVDGNIDMADALPALPHPNKWDSNDGTTGLRYQITRNMGDVELQISEAISTILQDFPEAQHLARECLHHSKRFALELCQFMTLDFQKWKHRGHQPKEAWKMTSVCVRCIFEEIYTERIVAHDIFDQKDPEFTAAKYLWATWRAHSVMQQYLKHQFYEHPSISAVLARHLADNYVKPDDAQASKIKALEAAIKSLQSKYDTMRVAHTQEKDYDYTAYPTKSLEPTKTKNFKGK
jgi:hypothetical protein